MIDFDLTLKHGDKMREIGRLMGLTESRRAILELNREVKLDGHTVDVILDHLRNLYDKESANV